MPQAAIFDVDGTLVDSVDLHASAWQEALVKFGHNVTFEQARRQIGKGGDQLIPVFLSEAEERDHGAEMEDWRSKLFRSKYLPLVRPFSAVPELLRRVREAGLHPNGGARSRLCRPGVSQTAEGAPSRPTLAARQSGALMQTQAMSGLSGSRLLDFHLAVAHGVAHRLNVLDALPAHDNLFLHAHRFAHDRDLVRLDHLNGELRQHLTADLVDPRPAPLHHDPFVDQGHRLLDRGFDNVAAHTGRTAVHLACADG